MTGTASGASPALSRRLVLLGLSGTALAACAGDLPNMPAQYFGTQTDPLEALRFDARSSSDLWERHLHAPSMNSAPNILVLSGGGEDGAFGAGLLVGWSTTHKRPDFDLITGISTGALIAPFAFLGSTHDGALRQIFTQYGADDLIRSRGMPSIFSDALYDTAPIARLLARYTPADFIDAVAAKHDTGARLLIMTSNLDTSQAVVWNMGLIAKTGQYHLFREVIRASAALPGLFPPVDLEYVIDGQTVRESHVDGGLNMQILAVPPASVNDESQRSQGGHLYMLINNTLRPAPQHVSRTVIGISQHALTLMVRSSAAATVDAAHYFTQQAGLELSVASIAADADIDFDPSERFSQAYMQSVFAHGFERATQNRAWVKMG